MAAPLFERFRRVIGGLCSSAPTACTDGDVVPIRVNQYGEGFVVPGVGGAISETLLNVENVVTTGGAVTYDRYIDVGSYRYVGLQIIISAPADPVVVTIGATIWDDETPAASCSYFDITSELTGGATITSTSYIVLDEAFPCKYLKVQIVIGPGGTNTSDCRIDDRKVW